MSKKINTKTTLVIVESPAKCKKIEGYLGPGYKCMASYGHIRELSSLECVDFKNNFKPTYLLIDGAIKRKNIELLRKEINLAREVILATDDDREGESIAWHICDVFKLDINKTKRIIFHEITETAIQYAIQNPTTLNLNLIQAQQARQILDLLVGFKISPILWKLIKKSKNNSLSAGRCQTPALKLVYENHKDINETIERKAYNTTAYFTNSNLPFNLNSEVIFEDEDEMVKFLDKSSKFQHIYACGQPTKVFKQPPDPFTTSGLQQVASNELHYSPKETMQLCQRLYEGGYITYMRTDSKAYCDEFIQFASDYITMKYDIGYFNLSLLNKESVLLGEAMKSSKKPKKAKFVQQQAHEAIRPTDISLQFLPEEMGSKEKKLYKLIWTNTLESCMTPASFYSITAYISAPENNRYSYATELINFPGWKIVENKFSRENKDYYYLQTIKKDSIIHYKKICSKVTIKGSKMHYTEAKLVQLLEEKGIGRPSTFSSLIDKIQERGYVKKQDVIGKEVICRDFELEDGEIVEIENKREFGNEKTKLIIQPLGIVVIEFLEKHFNKLFNYDYTSLMETSLDRISKGELSWFDVCAACNKEVEELITIIKDETKIKFQIDDNNTFIIGKYGPVIKCVEEKDGKEEITFKSIKKNIDVSKLQNGELALDEIAESSNQQNNKYNLGKYEGNDVILQKGKFGLYASWGENSKTLKELGNRPIENITFEDVKEYLEKGSNIIREINPNLSIRKGPKGDYLFYKNKKMKKPAFHDIKCFNSETNYDYKICDITILKSWICNKYNLVS
jgi:DNA topoisomerase-1